MYRVHRFVGLRRDWRAYEKSPLARRSDVQSDFESAAWADSHKHLSDMIASWIDKASYAFQRLQAIQYDAPWECARR
jgi:hypothetical protein